MNERPYIQVPATPHHPAYQHPVQQPVMLNYGGYPVPPQVPVQVADAVHAKRRQSIKVHLFLALFTMGIGNVLYAKMCNSDTASKYSA